MSRATNACTSASDCPSTTAHSAGVCPLASNCQAASPASRALKYVPVPRCTMRTSPSTLSSTTSGWFTSKRSSLDTGKSYSALSSRTRREDEGRRRALVDAGGRTSSTQSFGRRVEHLSWERRRSLARDYICHLRPGRVSYDEGFVNFSLSAERGPSELPRGCSRVRPGGTGQTWCRSVAH